MRSVPAILPPPAPPVLAARALPFGQLAQWLRAGQALFAMVGSRASMPHSASCLVAGLCGARSALGAANAALPLSLHPLNGALLLAASLGLLARVERGRDAMPAALAGAKP